MLRSSSVSLLGLFSATLQLQLWRTGPKKSHKKRTWHGAKYFLNYQGEGRLSAKQLDMKPHNPRFACFSEEVDRPFVIPPDATCFNCKKKMDVDADPVNYVWAPSGNAAVPTKAGYFFHKHCFKCWKCGFRIFNAKFYSQDNRAICLACAVGNQPELPTRFWHVTPSMTGRYSSRMAGHEFPRHKKQMEFLFDPET